MKDPIKVNKQRVITEYMLICPECYSKTVVGLEDKRDVECTSPECEYVFDKKHLD